MNMLKLTLQDFVVGVQETVLATRYPSQPEIPDSVGEARRAIYRSTRHLLEARELRHTVEFTYRGQQISVDLRRVYHVNKLVCRIVYVPKNAPDARRHPNKPHDIMAAQAAAWFCSKIYDSAPAGVRIVTRGMNTPGKDPAIPYTVERDYDLMPAQEVEKFITDRLDSIIDNLDTPDAELPQCTERERFVLKSDPFAKCRGVCRVRGACQQYQAALNAATDDLAATNQMFQ